MLEARMLELDSPRWSELHHAYGPARDTPSVLRQIYASPDDHDWGNLFGTVVHQGSVSTAAYAALPHVVAAAEAREPAERVMYLVFAGSVAAGIDAKPVPAHLIDDYRAAVVRARSMVLEVLHGPQLPEDDAIYLLAAAATLHGMTVAGHELEGLANEEFQFDCPECQSCIYATVDGEALRLQVEDPVDHPSAHATVVRPVGVDGPDGQSQAPRFNFLDELARAQQHARVVAGIRNLFGGGQCPACSKDFGVMNAIELGWGTLPPNPALPVAETSARR
jgi:hypothetical protein